MVDQAHRHGVKVIVNMFIGWGLSITRGGTDYASKQLTEIVRKDSNGKFVHVKKFLDIVEYFGHDGIGFNQEATYMGSQWADDLQDFMIALQEEATTRGLEFHTHWYDAQTNGGQLGFYDGLWSQNQDWFVKNGKTVSNGFFLNYNWRDSKLATSVTTANSLGANSFDIYAGFHVLGRDLYGGTAPYYPGWIDLEKHDISIGFWGEHDKNNIYKAAGWQGGGTDLGIQNVYQTKLEQVFSGGNQNPSNTPPITNSATLGGAITSFHGISKFITAKSTLQSLPFTTRFGTGNGQKFYDNGTVSHDNGWSNVGAQDYMPTWRWWITGNTTIKASLTFDDAYSAGSALKISGAVNTTKADISLFKTNFVLTGTPSGNITYKVPGATVGSDSKLSLALAFDNNPTSFTYFDLGNVTAQDAWNTKNIDLSAHIGKKVVKIGIAVDGVMQNNYEALIGELALTHGNVATPNTPTNTASENTNVRDGTPFVKMTWKLPGNPKHNGDIWYFNIVKVDADGNQSIVAKSTSRGHYLTNIALAPGEKMGVSSVAYDGKTTSEIAWFNDIKPASPVADFNASKTSIYTEETITFTDNTTLNPTSWNWEFTGGTPATSTDQNPTVTYNTQGTYAVTLTATSAAGSDTKTKTAFITVDPLLAPEADFTTNKTFILADETVTFNDNSSNNPTSWNWTFTGGTPETSTDQNPTVTYDALGTYAVTLTVTNSQGSNTETKTTYITVEPASAQVANFTASSTSVLVGKTVTFTDTSSENPTAWNWEFTGGTPATSTDQNPTISYNNVGTYEVTLTETHSTGSDTETKKAYITVNLPTPMGHWKFENNLNNDGYEGEDSAMVTGSEAYSSSETKEGSYSFNFNGVDKSIGINPLSKSTFLTQPFSERTITLWFYANDLTGKQILYEEGGKTKGLALRLNNDSLEGIVNASLTSHNSVSTSGVIANSWNFVSLTYGNNTMKLYLNGGTPVDANTVTMIEIGNHGTGGIGASNGQNAFVSETMDYFNGFIDDVRVYGITLNDIQVVATMNLSSDPDIILSNNDIEANLHPDTITIYPNPLNKEELLNVTYQSNSDTLVNFELINMIGVKVFTKTLKATSGNNTFKLDLSTIQQGTYLLTIGGNHGQLVKKIIIK